MNQTTIRTVRTSADRNSFIKFLWKVYGDNPVWVPPLLMDRKKLIDKEKNPFYKHTDAEFYLAERNGEIIGRIGAIVNHNHIKEHNEKVGFFGFFECIDDQEVADLLLNTAKDFLKTHNMTAMRGPANPSVNDEYGLLIDGFEHSPSVMMTYNPPYYAKLLENFGLKKEKDLFAYYLSHDKYCSEKMERVNKLLQERHSFSIRTMNMKKFHKDLELVKRIYNAGWSRNWGAVPLTDEEIEVLAADLKSVVDPDLVLFIEKDGEAIGFALTLPDVNIALKHNKSGWLLPGLFYLWKYKKKINFVRIIVLGVIPEYLNSGAGGLLLYETGKRSVAKGYIYGEASWVLEDNVRMVRAAETMKGEPYKKYRIYQIPI